METFTRGLDPHVSCNFYSVKHDMEAFFNRPVQLQDYHALSVCSARDPVVFDVLKMLNGIWKFHVHLRKYIQWAQGVTDVNEGSAPKSVYLGKNRTKYTFPSERMFALYFFHPKLREQWSGLKYVPRSPSFMSWTTVPIEWKPEKEEEDTDEDISSDEEDYDFDHVGMSWGDIQYEIEERRQQRRERLKQNIKK